MTRSLGRRPAAAAVAVLALASLAGCGGGDSDESSADAPSAMTTAPAAGAPSETTSPPPSDTPTAPDIDGESITAQDFVDVYAASLAQATTATVAMSVTGPVPSTVAGAIDFTAAPPSARLSITTDDGAQPQLVLLVGGTVYVQRADGRYDRTTAEQSPLAGSGGLNGLDPRALLAQLGAAITSATALGPEDADGAVLSHYRAELDTAALTTAAPAVAAALPDALTLDVYVDATGLLRRATIDLGAAAGLVDVRYDGWGEPVVVAAPPKNQVVEKPPG